MSRSMADSSTKIVATLRIDPKNPNIERELGKQTEISYQPIVEEIVQEVQFTYIPYVEKKTVDKTSTV